MIQYKDIVEEEREVDLIQNNFYYLLFDVLRWVCWDSAVMRVRSEIHIESPIIREIF